MSSKRSRPRSNTSVSFIFGGSYIIYKDVVNCKEYECFTLCRTVPRQAYKLTAADMKKAGFTKAMRAGRLSK